jgi:hypothetical protein
MPSSAKSTASSDPNEGTGQIPAIFPSNGSIVRRPLPSTGSLRVGSPASAVLRGAPIPCGLSHRASLSFARRFHPRPSFAPPGSGRASPRGQGCSPGSPTGSGGGGRASQVPGDLLLVSCPGLRPRWDLRARPSSALRCCFPLCVRRQLPPLTFRGSIPRPDSSLSTLRSLGYPRSTQDSLPAGGLLCRAGFEPAGVLREVSSCLYLIESSSPRLRLAHTQ